MVLEQLYHMDFLEHKTRYAFLLGICYTIIGIFSAYILFPQDSGIVAVAFTSLLILPSLNWLLMLEENNDARERQWNLFHMVMEHKDIIQIYLFLFLGSMLVFSFYSLIFSKGATSVLFAEQYRLVADVGHAVIPSVSMSSLLLNNVKVLLVIFLMSLIYGSGSIFLLIWNASVWGTVIGSLVRQSSMALAQEPMLFFLLTFISILPHLLAEALGYFCAVIAGGVLSTATLREKIFSQRFRLILLDASVFFIIAILLLVLGAYLEVYVGGTLINIMGLSS